MSRNEAIMISAEVIIKTSSGKSIAQAKVPITSENIDEFTPSEKAIKEVTEYFNALEFRTFQSGPTLTIVADVTKFEEVFDMKLSITRHKQTGDPIVSTERDPVVPDKLKDIVDRIVFAEPAEYFFDSI